MSHLFLIIALFVGLFALAICTARGSDMLRLAGHAAHRWLTDHMHRTGLILSLQKQIQLDPFNNVVATGIAICDLTKHLGSVLEKITLFLGGTTFTTSMITLIQLKFNGKVVWESTGANLAASNLYNGATPATGVLKIDFMDRRAVSVNARQVGAWDLSAPNPQLKDPGSGITTARLEVTISGATAPTLSGIADVSAPSPLDPNEAGIRYLGQRRHRQTQVIGGAGTYALQVPHIDPAGGGSNYHRILLFSANCTGLKAVREGVTEFDLQSQTQIQAGQIDNFKNPQANLTVFDPVQDGQLTGRTWDTRPSSGVRSAQFFGTFSAGETITIETEELLPFAAY